MGKVTNSANAAAAVYRAGSEIYDFSMACAEHTDEKVLNKMIENVQHQEPSLPYGKAVEKASTRFNQVKELEQGSTYFKELRHELNQEKANDQAGFPSAIST